MNVLSPRLVRCYSCWSLNEEGSECWCKEPEVKSREQIIQNEELKVEEVKIKVSMFRCNRCFSITSLKDECPKCRSKILIPLGLEEDPLYWATQFNKYDHKEPKHSVDLGDLGGM